MLTCHINITYYSVAAAYSVLGVSVHFFHVLISRLVAVTSDQPSICAYEKLNRSHLPFSPLLFRFFSFFCYSESTTSIGANGDPVVLYSRSFIDFHCMSLASSLTQSVYGPYLKLLEYAAPHEGYPARWSGSILYVCHETFTRDRIPTCRVRCQGVVEVLNAEWLDQYGRWHFWKFRIDLELISEEQQIWYGLQVSGVRILIFFSKTHNFRLEMKSSIFGGLSLFLVLNKAGIWQLILVQVSHIIPRRRTGQLKMEIIQWSSI